MLVVKDVQSLVRYFSALLCHAGISVTTLQDCALSMIIEQVVL
jgi:hypothetical protein